MTIHGEQGIHREIRTFNRLRSGSLLVMIRGPFGNGLQRGSVSSRGDQVSGPFCGLGTTSRTCGLGAGLNRTYCIAQGTLLNVMWEPGWETGLGENGYLCVCVWLSPFTAHLKLSQHCYVESKTIK